MYVCGARFGIVWLVSYVASVVAIPQCRRLVARSAETGSLPALGRAAEGASRAAELLRPAFKEPRMRFSQDLVASFSNDSDDDFSTLTPRLVRNLS